MKFKKLLISASAIAAGSGLLATVLTSCAKAKIDEKLKIELNNEGLLYDPANMKDTQGKSYKLDFKSAIEDALTRSTNWATFKNALAEEIVFKWFENRMAPSKDSDQKNASFRTSYDEWEYQIDKEYKDTVQSCKNKYGANWQFYLQNEYLAPLGGTEKSYKHAKLVEKIKADFISKVFAKSYFGMKTDTATDIKYPHIYAKATKNIDRHDLNNNANWGKLGFFARSEVSFDPGTTPKKYEDVLPNWLARHPDGDYAAIQDYVFNRWFKTDKPFFASAALFKYSNPTSVAHAKLDEIYDGTKTGVKIPTDKPSEAFPFFGAAVNSGTHKANEFLKNLKAGNFATPIEEKAVKSEEVGNGTITIPLSDSDDSQTCLLVTGKDMFTSLFTPYAMACGNLYGQMMGTTAKKSANLLKAQRIYDNFSKYVEGEDDDFVMLSNFFYTTEPQLEIEENLKLLDLNKVYGGESADKTTYHCPLFQNCPTYNWFYGGSKTGGDKGVRYLTNMIEVDDFASTNNPALTPAQPWVMELNEAGVHCLTIDGYSYVNDATKTGDKDTKLKQVVMYRLMQKQNSDIAAPCISAEMFGDKGKLKTYFNDNFANIILELATYKADTSLTAAEQEELNAKYNVFRTIESYKTDKPTEQANLFLQQVWKDQELGSTYDKLTAYLTLLDDYEENKKSVSSLETANNKIYSYRSKQISNAKSTWQYSKTVFENGLLTQFAYAPTHNTENNWLHDYDSVNRIVIKNYESIISGGAATNLGAKLKAIAESNYVSEVKAAAKVNDSTNGFCPQISAAKDKTSNRFWYKSALVDKLMYGYMGNKSNTANAIKMNAYDYYLSKHNGDWWKTTGRILRTGTESAKAFTTTYARNKLFNNDKNLASYATKAEVTAQGWGASGFYTLMGDNFTKFMSNAQLEGGVHGDECANYDLFKATVMYLMASDKEGGAAFDNFYTVLNSKIGEDEAAIVGYLANGYTIGASQISSEAIQQMPAAGTATVYDFNPDVDNIFDKNGYAGDEIDATITEPVNTKQSSSSYWNVVQKTYVGDRAREFAGFTGLQTKANNQLDSTIQTAVFSNFAKATYNAYDVNATTPTKHTQNDGCWFQFAGATDGNKKELAIEDLTVGSKTYKISDWFKDEYAPVRKVAKKIREYVTMDDLRSLAKTLADTFDGRSDFIDIASGSSTFETIEEMKYEMLRLLPSSYEECKAKGHINWFKRVSNVEAHTTDKTQSVVFKDSTGKNGHRLLMTQINKADALEKTITPKWEGTEEAGNWVMEANSPITPEEFWIILFNMASEATVQQRAVTEIVKTAFGDKKLIVYDAQLYNQFDSVWIKDWSKKTMGA